MQPIGGHLDDGGRDITPPQTLVRLHATRGRVRGVALRLAMLLSPALAMAQKPTCAPLDSTAPWALVNRAWSNESGLRWRNDSLRRVLLALRDSDQAMRENFGAQVTDTAYVRRLMRRDSVNAAEFRRILVRYGLPTRSMVGAAGADAAMLLAQHNQSLEDRVLMLARTAPPGEVSPQALAMLEDRVLVHQHKPQRFGTQFDLGADGLFHFDSTLDLPGLEARRMNAGMPPFDQYVCMMEEAGMRVDRRSLPVLRRP